METRKSYFKNCCNLKGLDSTWIVHDNNPREVNAFQVQLQGASQTVVADNANVIFDTIILNSSINSSITYNNATGVFTINRIAQIFSNLVGKCQNGAESLKQISLFQQKWEQQQLRLLHHRLWLPCN